MQSFPTLSSYVSKLFDPQFRALGQIIRRLQTAISHLPNTTSLVRLGTISGSLTVDPTLGTEQLAIASGNLTLNAPTLPSYWDDITVNLELHVSNAAGVQLTMGSGIAYAETTSLVLPTGVSIKLAIRSVRIGSSTAQPTCYVTYEQIV